MPYKSKAQLKFMHAKHPAIAKRWDKEYGVSENLPERAEKSEAREKKTARMKGGGIHGKR